MPPDQAAMIQKGAHLIILAVLHALGLVESCDGVSRNVPTPLLTSVILAQLIRAAASVKAQAGAANYAR